MEVFVSSEIFGELIIDEVFFYYDRPLLFTCKSSSTMIYLVMLVDDEPDGTKWLMVELSSQLLIKLKKSEISVRSIFVEADAIFQVVENEHVFTVVELDRSAVCSDDLPDEDLHISIAYYGDGTSGNVYELRDNDITREASAENRDILDIELIGTRSPECHEIAAPRLGEILQNIQHTLYLIAEKKDDVKGRISVKTKMDNTMYVTDTYAASFGLRLKSSNYGDLTKTTPLTAALESFAWLLNTKNSEVNVKSVIAKLGYRATVWYQHFLGTFIESDYSVSIKMASPNGQYYGTYFTMDEMQAVYDAYNKAISEEVRRITIKGTLIGKDAKTHDFRFESLSGDYYKGKLSSDLALIQHSCPSDTVLATIDMRIIYNSVTNTEKYEYTMISIEKAQDE